jgi:hypothetical protein
MKNTTKILSQDSLSQGQDQNPVPLEYEAGGLRLRRKVPWNSLKKMYFS